MGRLAEGCPGRIRADAMSGVLVVRRPLKINVLAVTEDAGFVRPLRLDMPLLTLKRQGLIADYFTTDPTLFNVPDDQFFHVVWLQRIRFSALIRHLEERVGSRYVYDIDDFMIGAPSYLSESELHRDSVAKAIKASRTLTVPSARLATMLETALGVKLSQKTVVCPNAFDFPEALRSPKKARGVLLTNSDALPLFANRAPFVAALRQFIERYDLPLYHVGAPFRGLESLGGRVVSLGRVPFWQYHFFLASMPPLIGLAPLETAGDKDTLEFIRGKSDIKMVAYGGFGHPSLYSNAPPYTETDIRAGLIVENTFASWRDGLEKAFHETWRTLDVEQREIVAKRHIDVIARDAWYVALEQAKLDKPIPGKTIKYASGRLRYYEGALRHMILSQDHAFRRDLQKNLPDFAIRLLRRFLIKI